MTMLSVVEHFHPAVITLGELLEAPASTRIAFRANRMTYVYVESPGDSQCYRHCYFLPATSVLEGTDEGQCFFSASKEETLLLALQHSPARRIFQLSNSTALLAYILTKGKQLTNNDTMAVLKYTMEDSDATGTA